MKQTVHIPRATVFPKARVITRTDARVFFRMLKGGDKWAVDDGLQLLSRKIAVKGGPAADTSRLSVSAVGSPHLMITRESSNPPKFALKVPEMGPGTVSKTIYITGLAGEALLVVLATQIIASEAASGAEGAAVALGAFTAVGIGALTAIIWHHWTKDIKSNYDKLANALEEALRRVTPKRIDGKQ